MRRLAGYSPALNLYLRWERGELEFYDPATGRPIATLKDERARADTAEVRANAAEAERNAEREARAVAETWATAAEARVRELEEKLHRREP